MAVIIYISSTYEDLKDQREAVYKALRRLNHDARAMEGARRPRAHRLRPAASIPAGARTSPAMLLPAAILSPATTTKPTSTITPPHWSSRHPSDRRRRIDTEKRSAGWALTDISKICPAVSK